MLLRNSLSNTKKFFQKTIHNFKSFISKGTTYEKLPKTPNIEAYNKELDNFYVEFTHQWDSHKSKLRNRASKTTNTTTHERYISPAKENVAPKTIQPQKVEHEKKNINEGLKATRPSSMNVVRGFRPLELSCSKSVREKRIETFSEKLKEIEAMDKSNIVHKMDVEEILHYYSNLICPPYVEIVDKFFKEICNEFLGNRVSPRLSPQQRTYRTSVVNGQVNGKRPQHPKVDSLI